MREMANKRQIKVKYVYIDAANAYRLRSMCLFSTLFRSVAVFVSVYLLGFDFFSVVSLTFGCLLGVCERCIFFFRSSID